MYMYRRGTGAARRVVHTAEYDRLGRPTGRSLCGRTDLDTYCNLPLGLRGCKDCARKERDDG